MGIKHEIVREDVYAMAPSCCAAYDASYAPPPSPVVMFDLTQMMYRLSKPSAENRQLMTGDELRLSFVRKLEKLHTWHAKPQPVVASALVVIMDKYELVPKEKAKTQQSRKSRAASAAVPILPYPKGTIVGDRGVLVPDTGAWTLLDIQRLARSGHMTPAVARYLYAAIPRQGVPVLMDCWAEGPMWAGETQQPRDTHVTEWAHGLGETDLALLYYTRVFGSRHPIVHVNVDGDQLPLSMRYLQQHEAPVSWHWIQHWTAGPRKPEHRVVDLVELHRLLSIEPSNEPERDDDPTPPLKRQRVPSKVLDRSWQVVWSGSGRDRIDLTCLYCIVFGTDYFLDKSLTLHANRKQVWRALHGSWPFLSLVLQWWSRDPADDKSLAFAGEAWTYFVRCMLHEMTNRTLMDEAEPGVDVSPFYEAFPDAARPPAISARIFAHPPSLVRLVRELTIVRERKKPFPRPPAGDDMREAMSQMRFNYAYWSTKYV